MREYCVVTVVSVVWCAECWRSIDLECFLDFPKMEVLCVLPDRQGSLLSEWWIQFLTV